ncbi:hypothetical protein C8F04DRAFT_1192728 [Mycena alexandri]|uniref:Uncharacterized protein n=1 Tax=Mycena alexandri TaxID=1745969 RepID=A0AAD6WWU9_9AGAR|nr:hypothetical protein C8F04DRAFT_1192728 [Mycena alexandri]
MAIPSRALRTLQALQWRLFCAARDVLPAGGPSAGAFGHGLAFFAGAAFFCGAFVGGGLGVGAMLARARTRMVNIPAQSKVATFKLRSRSWTWNRGLEHDSTSNFEIGAI